MIIKIVGKNVEVTEAMSDKIKEKLKKLDKYEYLKADTICHVIIRTVKDDQIIEVTIPVENKKVIRAEKRANSLYTAIDMIDKTLARKIKKEKGKILSKKRVKAHKTQETDIANLIPMIVKEKFVPLFQMTLVEAQEQMEALNHDFHLFENADTGNMCVIYRRNDSDYGVIHALV